MAAAKKFQYVVTAAVAVVKVAGSEKYLYKGAVLPASVEDEHRDHLVKVGLVSKQEIAPVEEKPKGDTPPAGDDPAAKK